MNDEMICIICGSTTTPEATYCWNCGFALHSRLASNPTILPAQTAACAQQNRRRRGLFAGLLVIGSVGGIAASFAQFWPCYDNSSSRQEKKEECSPQYCCCETPKQNVRHDCDCCCGTGEKKQDKKDSLGKKPNHTDFWKSDYEENICEGS